ncbi:nucleotide-binding domain-containing protein [Nocardioides alcanivorans]|uniref:nucleotide-binding domain-containing protein n=1 Tax=Nocardioides alcanivorans TaxID=2897352 RepID=UPI0035E1481B
MRRWLNTHRSRSRTSQSLTTATGSSATTARRQSGQMRYAVTSIRTPRSRTRTETTSYIGHYYVEAMIVKNGVCVAQSRQDVIVI